MLSGYITYYLLLINLRDIQVTLVDLLRKDW